MSGAKIKRPRYNQGPFANYLTQHSTLLGNCFKSRINILENKILVEYIPNFIRNNMTTEIAIVEKVQILQK